MCITQACVRHVIHLHFYICNTTKTSIAHYNPSQEYMSYTLARSMVVNIIRVYTMFENHIFTLRTRSLLDINFVPIFFLKNWNCVHSLEYSNISIICG